jgi:hypothetical protein
MGLHVWHLLQDEHDVQHQQGALIEIELRISACIWLWTESSGISPATGGRSVRRSNGRWHTAAVSTVRADLTMSF